MGFKLEFSIFKGKLSIGVEFNSHQQQAMPPNTLPSSPQIEDAAMDEEISPNVKIPKVESLSSYEVDMGEILESSLQEGNRIGADRLTLLRKSIPTGPKAGVS